MPWVHFDTDAAPWTLLPVIDCTVQVMLATDDCPAAIWVIDCLTKERP